MVVKTTSRLTTEVPGKCCSYFSTSTTYYYILLSTTSSSTSSASFLHHRTMDQGIDRCLIDDACMSVMSNEWCWSCIFFLLSISIEGNEVRWGLWWSQGKPFFFRAIVNISSSNLSGWNNEQEDWYSHVISSLMPSNVSSSSLFVPPTTFSCLITRVGYLQDVSGNHSIPCIVSMS